MNAAARDINQTNFFHGQLINLRLSFASVMHLGLMLIVLISSLAVIYTTNYHRLTLSRLEVAEQHANQMQLEWGQLLLEQASLATPSRVELLAATQLNMRLPGNKNMIVLRAK
jgi:cell division protein FtsL